MDKITEIKDTETVEKRKWKESIKDKEFNANLIRIVVNFLQVSSIVIDLNIEWPDSVR